MSDFPLCHWSSQLFDLRAPSSTDVPVLLLNQPIIPDGVHAGLKIVDTKAFEHVISGLSQFSVGAGQTFSHPITPAHCFGAVSSVRCVLIRCVFALTFTGIRFLFPGFCVI